MFDQLWTDIGDMFSSTETKTDYRVEGKAAFRLDPIAVSGTLPYHTCTIQLRAFGKDNEHDRITIKTKWFRVIEKRNYEIESYADSEYYNFSSLDIGCYIRCYVESRDPKHKGKLQITFKKTRFDESQRQSLESVLISGYVRFQATYNDDADGGILESKRGQDIHIFVGGGHVKFKFVNAKDQICFFTELNDEFLGFEIPENAESDLDTVSICFREFFEDETNGNAVNKSNSQLSNSRLGFYKDILKKNKQDHYAMNLKFMTRDSRDIFVLSCKLFKIIPLISISNLFRQLEEILRENKLFSEDTVAKQVSLCEAALELESIRNCLSRSIAYVKFMESEKTELHTIISDLETDLVMTINDYGKLVQELKVGSQTSTAVRLRAQQKWDS